MTGIDIEKDEQQNIRNNHIFEMAQSRLSCLKTPTTAKYTLSDPVAQFVDSF